MKTKEKTQKRYPSTIHPFAILIISTENKIGDRGATSLSDALKSNTTLTKLNLRREKKRKKTQKESIYNSLSSILIVSTVNGIQTRGAKSLSEALKSNTTLIKLDLSCGNKRKGHKQRPSIIHSFPLSYYQQATTLEKYMQHHFMNH